MMSVWACCCCRASIRQAQLLANHYGGVTAGAYLIKSALVNTPAYAVLAGWPVDYQRRFAYFAGAVEVGGGAQRQQCPGLEPVFWCMRFDTPHCAGRLPYLFTPCSLVAFRRCRASS